MDKDLVKNLIARSESVEARVDKLKNDFNRETIELDYDKRALKEKMDLLKKKGLEFSNLTELETEIDRIVGSLNEVLDATERKLSELD